MKKLKFIKAECGVEVLLNVGLETNLKHLYLSSEKGESHYLASGKWLFPCMVYSCDV